MNLWNLTYKDSIVDEATLEKACHRVGNFLVEEARKNLTDSGKYHIGLTRVNTGMLMQSIHYDVEKVAKGKFLLKLGSNLDYAPYVEFGTGIYGGTNERYGEYASGPGRQTPWAWYDPSGKYTKSGEPGFVWTSGMKPRPYIYPAILENGDKVAKIIGKTINEEARKK